jgi:ribosomal 50S subunit-recycling heat shock protein
MFNGRILKNSDDVKEDDLIDTQLYNGTLKSKVVEKKGTFMVKINSL